MTRLLERRWPVGIILVGIAALLVLPGLLFGTLLLDRFAKAERAEAQAETLATAARVADALDHELGTLFTAARVLATTRSLVEGDIAGFANGAAATAAALGDRVILATPEGKWLYNSAASAGGSKVLSPGQVALIQRVAAERRAIVSNVFISSVGEPRIAVDAPVLRDGAVIFVVGLSLDPAYFSTVLVDQALPAGWIASIRDAEDHVLARVPALNGHAPPAPRSSSGGQPVWDATSQDGEPVFATSVRTRLADWHVGIGVPVTAFERPIHNTVRLFALGGLATLILACALAWLLARSISGPLQRLAEAGRELGEGRRVALIPSRLREVEDLAHALVGASSDLAARTEALSAERARLAAIIETVPVGLLIADAPSGRIVAGNRHVRRLLPQASQLDREQVAACFDQEGERVPTSHLPLTRALAGEDLAELRARYRRADDTLFWVQAVAAPIRAADEHVTGAVLALLDVDEVVRAREEQARWAERLEAEVATRTAALEQANQHLRDEVTARSRAEDQLRQAQKMEAVGRLTGGIAHDFNNLLTVIMGSLELLRRRLDGDARLVRLVDNATEGATRAASLTASLLAFARRQPLVPRPIDVNALVSGMSNLIRRTLGATIEVQTALGDDVWPATADPNQLESAILNLAVNARDAILEASPGGGTLRLETANVTLDALYAAQVSDAKPGDYVVIATEDTGTGMSDETLAQVFEPFFTTKPMGQGTGLGLSQVHGFAIQSGGHVTIHSALGRGTTVRLFLPRLVGSPGQAPPADTELANPSSRAGETILIVEDDPGVRQFTGEALRELGYHVHEAGGADQALALLEAHPEIRLVMSDVVMAGMDGNQLAEIVHQRRPGMAILLTSGYRRGGGPDEVEAGWELLSKPFTVSTLARTVYRSLSQGHQDRALTTVP